MPKRKIQLLTLVIVLLVGCSFFPEIYLKNHLVQAQRKNRLKDTIVLNNQNSHSTYNLKKIAQIKENNSLIFNVLVQNDSLFIIDEKKGLQIFDISEPGSPVFITSYQKTEETRVYGLAIDDNFIYLAYGKVGVVILDYSNRSNLVEVNTIVVEGSAWDLLIQDNLLFIVDRQRGIIIVDIEDPTQPQIINSITGTPMGISRKGDYLFVAEGWNKGLGIYKITDLLHPEKVAELKERGDDTVSIVVDEKYAYLATRGNGLKIVSIEDITKPQTISSYKDQGQGFCWDVVKKEHLLYLADESDGLEVVDITRPTNPIEVGQYNDNSTGRSFNLGVKKDLIFVADYNDGLKILTWKITSPAPITSDFKTIDIRELNFNHTVGPFITDQNLGNETMGLDLQLSLEVGLKAPIAVKIESPKIAHPGEELNLRLGIESRTSSFWSSFQGNMSINTPYGSSEIFSLQETGLPQYLEVAAFSTIIGEEIDRNTQIEPRILWKRDFFNYTLSLQMTSLFNITGSAIICGVVQQPNIKNILEWNLDGERVIVPLELPKEYKEKEYEISLEELKFIIDELRLDLWGIRFDLLAMNAVPIETWIINLEDFQLQPFTENLRRNEEQKELGERNQKEIHEIKVLEEKAENNRTLFLLDGIYPLETLRITIPLTKISFWEKPLGLMILLLFQMILLVLPWILIIIVKRKLEVNIKTKVNSK
jgi:hypothetical protein